MISKIFKFILNLITWILIVIIVLYLILAIYQRVIRKQDMFKIGKYYVFQIASGSMEYGLHVGDYILVEEEDEYFVGDVVTFRENNYFVTHRINEINSDDMIVTKGDANITVDEDPIPVSAIVGKFLFKLDLLTFISQNRLLFIGFVLILFGASFYFNKRM